MRKTGLVLIALLLVGGVLGVTTASAVITGSAHDFKTRSWNPSGQICIVCHTPHHAQEPIIPSWNHVSTTATFTLYTSPTLNASLTQPDSSSKACLSCHDGTVAYDSFGSQTGTRLIGPTRRVFVGTDLKDDHPVSFTYDAALATTDGALHDPTAKTITALGGKTVDVGMLKNHKLECSSCHDVHRFKGDSVTAGKLLLVNNTASALCLSCHSK